MGDTEPLVSVRLGHLDISRGSGRTLTIEGDGKELLERAHGLNQLLDEPIRRPVTDNGDVQTATRVEP